MAWLGLLASWLQCFAILRLIHVKRSFPVRRFNGWLAHNCGGFYWGAPSVCTNSFAWVDYFMSACLELEASQRSGLFGMEFLLHMEGIEGLAFGGHQRNDPEGSGGCGE